MYATWNAGVDWTSPATNKWVRAIGDSGNPGWPNSPQVEGEIAAWFVAKTLEQEKAAARRINNAALEHVVHVPRTFSDVIPTFMDLD